MTDGASQPPGDGPLARRLEEVRGSIADAARASGRAPEDIRLLVVTKYQPVSMIRELYRLGVRDFGENRHQEARAKAAELADLPLRWHFVGQLQRKKARQVREYAHVIHSVDRPELVRALAGDDPCECFVQVNLTDDPDRGGIRPDGVAGLAEEVLAADGLTLLGVMAVAPLDVEPARAFARLREISETVRALDPAATGISAGMSADYRAAIAAGATHLRIGSAITGNRPDGR